MTRSRGWILGLAGIAGSICVVGCIAMPSTHSLPQPVGQVFRGADEVILYSLAPTTPAGTSPEMFHGFAIVGKTEVKDSASRKKLFNAFSRGVEDHDGSVAACFIPHHGLRVRKGDQTVDLVICFLCAQVRVYPDSTSTSCENILISKSPRATFNEVLRAANVPVDSSAE